MRPKSLKLRRVLCASPICLFVSFACAQSNNLSEVVVTATRQESRASEAISDITIIGSKEIQNAGQSTLAELLGRQPGIEFKSDGGPGSVTNVSVRGSNSGHVLLLVDGIRVGSATLGAPTWQYIPLEQIDRIEILRGAASSLYGSDAIGGVIQVFTKRGDGPLRAQGQVGYGSYNTKTASAGVQGGEGGWHYSAQVSDKTSDSFAAALPSNVRYYDPAQHGLRSTSSSGRLSRDLANGQEVGLNYLYSQGWNRYNSYFETPVGPENKNYQTISSVGAYAKNQINESWSSKVQWANSADDNKNYGNNALMYNYRTTQNQFLWQNDVVLASGLALIGVERLDQKVGSNDTAYVVNSRTIDSAFAGWVKNSDVHNFQFNLRRDQNSQFGGKSTGLLGYGMRLTPEWQVKTSWGTGFKAPTFNDLYYPYGGNSALKPETSVNREFAVHRDQQDSHFAVIHYVNSINNLIQWIPINLDIYSPQNVASATINGWTFTYKDQFAGYRWGASLDLQDPKDNTLQKTLYYRSRETAKFNVEKDFASLNLGAEWMASVRRYADTDNQQVLGGYGLLNLYGGYKISNDIAVTFRLNNALDKKYSLSQGYAMPGINWFTGLRFNLN